MRRLTGPGPSGGHLPPYNSRDQSLRHQLYGMPPGRIDAPTRQAMMQLGQGDRPGCQPNFTPSQTLRAAIEERLEAQHKALEEASEEVQRLLAIGEAGKSDPNQLPGDQQISGEDLAAITHLAKVEGATNNRQSSRSGFGGQTATRISRSFTAITPPSYARPRVNEADPIGEYQQLDREIAALVGRIVPQQSLHHGRSNPYQAMADQYAERLDPRKAQREKLEKVLGPANGIAGGQRYAGSVSGSTRSVSPHSSVSQQQPAYGSPVASVCQLDGTGQARYMHSGMPGDQYNG